VSEDGRVLRRLRVVLRESLANTFEDRRTKIRWNIGKHFRHSANLLGVTEKRLTRQQRLRQRALAIRFSRQSNSEGTNEVFIGEFLLLLKPS